LQLISDTGRIQTHTRLTNSKLNPHRSQISQVDETNHSFASLGLDKQQEVSETRGCKFSREIGMLNEGTQRSHFYVHHTIYE
jgi:CHASE1-domain containing sensor protein